MRWIHIGIRDLTITVRDKASIGILIAMPMILIVILSSALGNLAENLGKTAIGVVNLDRGRIGGEVTDGFFKDGQLTKLFAAQRLNTPEQARELVARGDLAGALIVPEDFSRNLNNGRASELTLLTDPGREIAGVVTRSVAESLSIRVSSASIAARTAAFYALRLPVKNPAIINATIGKAIQSARETGTIEAVALDERTAAKGEEISQLAYYSGGMSVMFLMFGAMFGAFSLVRERDNWTLPRMLMTPTSRVEILGGKLFGVFIIGVVQFAVLYGFTSAIGVKWGDPVALALVALSTVCAATGLSVFVAAVGKTVRAVSGLAQMIIQFMAAVGGSFMPVSVFPSWLQPVHYASVNGWAIDAILNIMRGSHAVSVLPNVAALLFIAALFFGVGAWRLRWE